MFLATFDLIFFRAFAVVHAGAVNRVDNFLVHAGGVVMLQLLLFVLVHAGVVDSRAAFAAVGSCPGCCYCQW